MPQPPWQCLSRDWASVGDPPSSQVLQGFESDHLQGLLFHATTTRTVSDTSNWFGFHATRILLQDQRQRQYDKIKYFDLLSTKPKKSSPWDRRPDPVQDQDLTHIIHQQHHHHLAPSSSSSTSSPSSSSSSPSSSSPLKLSRCRCYYQDPPFIIQLSIGIIDYCL